MITGGASDGVGYNSQWTNSYFKEDSVLKYLFNTLMIMMNAAGTNYQYIKILVVCLSVRP